MGYLQIMKNKRELKNYPYKIYRKELGKKLLLCSSMTEDMEQFKRICMNSEYIITYNDKDITKKYR